MLDCDDQRLLATWVAKTVMAAEFIDRTKVAIPSSDRDFLMRELSPPDGWWIWITGIQGTQWNPGINHMSGRHSRTPEDLKNPHALNVQSTTVGLGRLLVQAVSTTVPDAKFALVTPEVSDFKPLWPQSLSRISWPPPRLLTDDDINHVARNLARAFGFPGPSRI